MIKAIVYNSNTGFTKKYAEMLSDKINVPCYEGEKAHYVLEQKDEIIFMSWISANRLKGLKNVKRLYDVKAVCAVGLAKGDENKLKEIISGNKIKNDIPFFYLRGGMDNNKLKGFDKFAINQVGKILEKASKKDPNIDEEMYKSIKNGADFVNEENIEPIVEWFNLLK